MSGSLYCETFIEHAEDGFRWRFSQIDGIISIDYQEYVNDAGDLCTTMTGGEWRTKSSFEGLWIEDLEEIKRALSMIATLGGKLNGA